MFCYCSGLRRTSFGVCTEMDLSAQKVLNSCFAIIASGRHQLSFSDTSYCNSVMPSSPNFFMATYEMWRWFGVSSREAGLSLCIVHCNVYCRVRMLPLVWWQQPEDRSIWVWFSVIFTGYQYDSGSSSRQQFWRTSVSTAWPQNTSSCTASQRQLSPADVSGLLTPVDWLFPAPGRATATAVLPPRDRVRGTVFLLNSEQQMLDLKRSDANWRHYYSTCSYDCSAFAAF